jgi:hypothetical protein
MVLAVSPKNPDGKSIEITKDELALIRTFPDFDLTMFLSELHDFGWPVARRLLPNIKKAMEIRQCQSN